MKIALSLVLYVFLIILFLLGCNSNAPNAAASFPLLGTWEVKSIAWISKDTVHTIAKAQPGMFLFTPTGYSLMWTPTPGPRTPFRKLAEPDSLEIRSGFASIVFNAGSYRYTDSTLVTTAKIAKVPGFEKGTQFYDYRMLGEKLQLTMYDETYPDGTKPDWSGTWKTRFILEKVVPRTPLN